MGFDVYGLNPKENTKKPKILTEDVWSMGEEEKEKYFKADEKFNKDNPGVYFRNNVWWWRPLWNYVCGVCEDVMSEKDMIAGTGNEGLKINESTTDRMVEKLITEIALDNHLKFEIEYMESLKNLPKEDCTICDATGKRKNPPEIGAGDIKCNGCNGRGKKDPWAASYPFSAENVEEFVNFLSESGGIQIC